MWFLNMIFLHFRKGTIRFCYQLLLLVHCTGVPQYAIYYHFRCKSGISFYQVGIMFTDFLWLNVFSALLKLLALRVLVSCTYFVGLCGCTLLPNDNRNMLWTVLVIYLHISNMALEEELLNRINTMPAYVKSIIFLLFRGSPSSKKIWFQNFLL